MATAPHSDVLSQLESKLAVSTESEVDGKNPLHWAASPEVARCLLETGAVPTTLDKNGWNPLHAACAHARYGVVAVLVASSSELNTPDHDGYYPLHLALFGVWQAGCSSAAMETLQLLVGIGGVWDSTCDQIAEQVASWPTSMGKQPDNDRDDRWRVEASALRVCFDLWTREHTERVPFTAVPVEQIHRGRAATKTYLRALNDSVEWLSRTKICVVGPRHCGKTSLIKSLTTGSPSLAAREDRTIAIDQFLFTFEENVGRLSFKSKHEVTFWDFAGQDAFQATNSLFYSRRSLYFVCVDLESFVAAHTQPSLMADADSQSDRGMIEFVETKILRWIHTICTFQPDAEFVFVATKSDSVPQSDLNGPGGVVDELRKLLENVTVIIHEIKNQESKKTIFPQRTGTFGLTGIETAKVTLPIMHLGDPRLASMVRKPHVRMIVASCLTAESIGAFKTEIQDVIKEVDRRYTMPHKYSQIREALLSMKADVRLLGPEERLAKSFLYVDNLVKELVSSQPDGYLDECTCLAILRTLRDLGDVLWYDAVDDELLISTVIVDPMLMVDLVREIFDHSQNGQVITHKTLKSLQLWKHLEGTDLMLVVKRVLQHFHVVSPTTGEMAADSDLVLSA